MSRTSIELEFIFKASPAILYKFITTPSCLIRWFCDGVDITGDEYVFEWQGADEIADLIEDIEEERLRFKWRDADDPAEYFEFRMYRSDVTNETILEITDFCDEDETDSVSDLWRSQMVELKKEAGG